MVKSFFHRGDEEKFELYSVISAVLCVSGSASDLFRGVEETFLDFF